MITYRCVALGVVREEELWIFKVIYIRENMDIILLHSLTDVSPFDSSAIGAACKTA